MKPMPRISLSHYRRLEGFTLVELMVAFALAVVVIGVIAAITIFTAQNFLATTNYVDMDNQSRNALDKISREVRNASALLSQSPNAKLVLTNSLAATSSIISYDSVNRTLKLTKSGEGTTTLLTECDTFTFSLYNRYPTANLSFYTSTNFQTGSVDAKFCKVINMNWKCSRKILGSKLNTEIVQTAQVVLRNQVTQ